MRLKCCAIISAAHIVLSCMLSRQYAHMLIMLPLAVMKVIGCVLINFDSSLIMSPLYIITGFFFRRRKSNADLPGCKVKESK